MENNNNDRKMFITVLSIATLIITIAGGTFAYFSAQTNSAPNAVGAGAANAPELYFWDNDAFLKTNMIPSTEDIATYAAFVDVKKEPGNEQYCLDDNGNEVCSIYVFGIDNNSDIAQTVNITLTTTYLNKFTNLSYKVYYAVLLPDDELVADLTSTEIFALSDLPIIHSAGGDKVPILNGTDAIDSGTIIPGGGDLVYSIVIWLNETNTNQNAEAGGSWSATINVTTGTGTGITGVIDFNRPASSSSSTSSPDTKV